MHIIFYGPEGSGKGTQAKLLGDRLQLPVLTSGDIVREHAMKDNGPLGDVCREALKSGTYVADTDMYVLWEHRLQQEDAKAGWIMDGFPRTIEQAKFLVANVAENGYAIDVIFYLTLSEEESYKRLIARARPMYEGSKELHDSPERIRHRLAVYKQAEGPLVAFFRSLGILTEIPAQRSIAEVHNDIVNYLPQ